MTLSATTDLDGEDAARKDRLVQHRGDAVVHGARAQLVLRHVVREVLQVSTGQMHDPSLPGRTHLHTDGALRGGGGGRCRPYAAGGTRL